jgi:hypothetical protein
MPPILKEYDYMPVMPELRQKALEWYEKLRATIEVPENIGKLLSIDVETGNYAIGDDASLTAPHSLREKNPEARIYTLRIGYNAVYALGGVLEKTAA